MITPIKVICTFERTTKRYHVYRVVGEGFNLTERVYVPIDHVEGTPPDTITMTIE
jgi:hypothetical protein